MSNSNAKFQDNTNNMNISLLRMVISNSILRMVIFNSMVRTTVAMVFINEIFIPWLRGQMNPIVIIVRVGNVSGDDDNNNDAYFYLEEGESLSPPHDWEDSN